jgi:carboxyl-terminal processing protease
MKKFALTLILIAATMAAVLSAKNEDNSISPDQKLRLAAALINNYYVETVNPDTIVDEAIVAMLRTLDPHSSYTTPSETEELNQPLEGKFSGIGIQFNIVEDTVYVIQTTSGGPSEKMGIRPGDRIISANDTVIAGKKITNRQVLKTLRGPKGSVVNVKVKRNGEKDLIDFVLVRDDIPIYSVDAAYMVDDSIGYISVSRFAEATADEVYEAADSLVRHGMRHLIIDLGNNGGGYLGSAYNLASEFLHAGDPVVYTRGLHSPSSYLNVETTGQLPIDRLVIMVDQYSASASEILSGAIQDNDRGLIVGRRTFGKGLVQRPFPFPDGSMIRLTTSRYYTPSGRCIQKPYEKGKGDEYQLDLLNRYNSGELWHVDSIKLDTTQVYHTLRNGRTVYGGGGIMPDVFVPVDTSSYTPYYRDLVAKGAIMKYVIANIEANRKALLRTYPNEEIFAKKYVPTDEDVKQIIDRGTQAGVAYNEEQWTTSRDLILAVYKGLMTRDLYEKGIYVRSTNPLNADFNAAVDLIRDAARYNALLKGK